MSLRVCTSKVGQIDAALEQLRQHILTLTSKGTLVKDTADYKKQLLLENEMLKNQVEDLKCQLVDAEVMNGRRQVTTCTAIKTNSVPVSKPVQPVTITKAPSTPTPQAAISDSKPQEKKNAAKKQQSKKGQAPKAAADQSVDVSRLDMRVAFIKSAKLHPDADGLYIEEIECGEPEPRQVISGLVKHIPIDQMQERPCVLLCNLKPAKMRGILSHAMVMCASTPEKVELLEPPANSKPGDRVSVEGYIGSPDEQLNPKKKVFEAVQPDFLVSQDGYALYKGVRWKINGEGVTAPSMRGCGIK